MATLAVVDPIGVSQIKLDKLADKAKKGHGTAGPSLRWFVTHRVKELKFDSWQDMPLQVLLAAWGDEITSLLLDNGVRVLLDDDESSDDDQVEGTGSQGGVPLPAPQDGDRVPPTSTADNKFDQPPSGGQEVPPKPATKSGEQPPTSSGPVPLRPGQVHPRGGPIPQAPQVRQPRPPPMGGVQHQSAQPWTKVVQNGKYGSAATQVFSKGQVPLRGGAPKVTKKELPKVIWETPEKYLPLWEDEPAHPKYDAEVYGMRSSLTVPLDAYKRPDSEPSSGDLNILRMSSKQVRYWSQCGIGSPRFCYKFLTLGECELGSMCYHRHVKPTPFELNSLKWWNKFLWESLERRWAAKPDWFHESKLPTKLFPTADEAKARIPGLAPVPIKKT